MALAVAKHAAEQLLAAGVEVELTRATDVHVSLADRVHKSAAFKADIFLSVHCNSASSHEANGIETIFAAHIPLSKAIGNTLHQSIMKAAHGHRDRGLKGSPSEIYPARLYVLAGSKIPALLVELEFISHPQQEQWLVAESTHKTLGHAIARGLIQGAKNLPGVQELEA